MTLSKKAKLEREKPIEYTEGVKRYEDMSPTGFIELYRQDDGDVVIIVHGTDMKGEKKFATVEFCTSGGQSLNTLLALIDLIEAMKKDNEERGQHRCTNGE